MKMKFNENQLAAFIMLVKNSINEYAVMQTGGTLDVQGKIYKSLLEAIWIRAQKKFFIKQKTYSLKLEPHEAMLLFLEYNSEVNSSPFMQSYMLPKCIDIHKKYIV